MSFKISGTTGDAGLAAQAAGPGALSSDLAMGLYSLSSGSRSIKPETVRRVSLSAGTPQSLLVNFLNELIFLIDTECFLASSVKAEASFAEGSCRLEAELKGEADAFKRHQRGLLVKAATYHDILVENKNGLWRAKVVLDI